MSRVARIELYHVAIPLPAWFRPAWIPGMPLTDNRCTLVRILTDDGVEGWSAGPAIGRERAGLGDLLGPYLLGERADDIDLVQQRLREIGYLGWRNWWVEPAFWDIKGKLEGKPVCELLGVRPGRVQLYASTGEVKGEQDRIDEVEARYDEGFRVVKLRVHGDEESDATHITEVARACGDRMRIAVDANQGWRVTIIGDSPLWDLARAKRFAEVCADHDVAWIEEPLAMDRYDELTELTGFSQVPIAGGELHSSGWPELAMMIDRRCYDIFQPDTVFTGGIAQSIEVARRCREHGLRYSPHTWTNGIGFAVNLQVFAASGFADGGVLEYPIAPPGWTVEARDALLVQPFEHDQGWLEVPTGPGLGFEIDRRALRRWGKRFFAMDRKRLIWFSLRHRGVAASKEIDRNRRARLAAERPGEVRHG
jgi:D-galactarolactone cycloisomerase